MYVSLEDYERYKNEHEIQGAIVARVEIAYSTLEKSHRELLESYKNTVKREKKRDKFHTKLWK